MGALTQSVATYLPDREVGSFSAASRSTIEKLPLTSRRGYKTCRPVVCFQGSADCVFFGGRIPRSPRAAACGFPAVPASFEDKNAHLLSSARGVLKLFLRLQSLMGPAPPPARGAASVTSEFELRDGGRVTINLYTHGPYGPDGFAFEYTAYPESGVYGYKTLGSLQGGEHARVHGFTVLQVSYTDARSSLEYSFNPLRRFGLQGTAGREALLDRILGDEFHSGGVGEEHRGRMRISLHGEPPAPERQVTFKYESLEDLLARRGSR